MIANHRKKVLRINLLQNRSFFINNHNFLIKLLLIKIKLFIFIKLFTLLIKIQKYKMIKKYKKLKYKRKI